MSLLQKIRPRWLQFVVRFTLAALVGLGIGGLVAGAIILIATHVPPFSDWEPQEQETLIDYMIRAFALVVVVWLAYRIWKRRRANSWHRKGLQLSLQDNYREALAAYDQALSIQPKFVGTWTNKALILSHLKRHDEALAAINKALALNVYDPLTWINRGVILIRITRYDEALSHFDRAIKLDPTNRVAWNNKASVLCDYLARYNEALTICDEAIARGISTAGIWALQGKSLQHLGREAEARAAYTQVLTFPADDLLSWASHGLALNGLSRYDEALVAYDQALTIDLYQEDVLRERAIALRALGRDDEAREAERQAEELER
jgi:protein O-GlcNAc transferase